ncbi:hypothetical protein AVEN_45981-1 [Araneus ventricosus]|uniref:Uncharacterized protein n=1 Tax=Araneus ventricosus TaxID=182803 RepID=A0A4Y2FTZ1_ARAVE|nr:hypothetical protein AVEN_30239-1 [Araneus ventricosus]GBM43104.1 hypothetical protein AVEN_45981-1 [Araneus ventricosus]
MFQLEDYTSNSYIPGLILRRKALVPEDRGFETRFDSTEDPPCIRAWCTFNLRRVERCPRWYGAEVWGEQCRVVSSLSYHGSKLRGPS